MPTFDFGIVLKMKTIFFILAIALSQCTILEFHNPNKGVERRLSDIDTECNDITEHRHWTFLYGTMPISFLNKSTEVYFEKGKSFRIKEKANAIDFVISILGGFSTSITVRTIVVEYCDAVTSDKSESESKFENLKTEPTKEENPKLEKPPEVKEKKEIILDENALFEEQPVKEQKIKTKR